MIYLTEDYENLQLTLNFTIKIDGIRNTLFENVRMFGAFM